MKHSQRGAGMMMWMIILSSVGFFVLIGLKVIPMYSEFNGVMRSVNQLKSADAKNMSKEDIQRKTLDLLYKVGDVRSINADNFKEHFQFKQVSDDKFLVVSYFREAPIFKNIFVTVKFNEEVRL
jgi:hypothetical protein